ncbi:hypothetical protein [Bordetella flabilis]|uniref:Uncharacterized protein n=1 Tax=Bordetella flabilis TaxID=463014 RepID=A0A193GBD6_9BORD|nr:hypothetical protein [Bordetella flabilis]ANN76771.1 hypothetical protein BAU07_06285 [Bordetella flabilis]
MNKLVQAGTTPPTAGLSRAAVLAHERAARFVLRAALPAVLQSRDQPSRADTVLFRSILDAGPHAWPAGEEAGGAEHGSDGRGRHGRNGGTAKNSSEGMDGAGVGPPRQTDRHGDGPRAGSHADAAGAPGVHAVGGIVVRVCVQSQQCGGRGVRMTLDNDVLPGTQLSVYEDEGRLAVVFVSMHAGTQLRLCHGAGPIARRVAAELSRDVLLRVAVPGQEERALVEVTADAPSSSGNTDDRGGRP